MDDNNFKATWKDEPEARPASSDDPAKQAIINKLAANMPPFETMQGMAYSLAYSVGFIEPGPDDPADAVIELYKQLPAQTQEALMRLVRQIGLATAYQMVMNGKLELSDDSSGDERHRSFLHSMETLKEHWPQEVRRLKSYVAYLRGKISALENGRIGGPVQSAKIECRRKDTGV